jgi:hypothetical protein
MSKDIALFVCPRDDRLIIRRGIAMSDRARHPVPSLALALGLLFAFPACAAPAAVNSCQQSDANPGAAEIVGAIGKLRALLSKEQLARFDRPFDYANATHWSNLPIGLVPRTTLRLGDLDPRQAAAARRVFAAALSACGLDLLDEVRRADDFLVPFDKRPIGWGGGNYYMAVLGMPSTHAPWMLQIGGHHLAYNFTFNGRAAGATPLFFGTEPIRFESQGVMHEPLSAQSRAMSQLAAAIAPRAESRLSGTFTDVVKGVYMAGPPGPDFTGGTDSKFPQTYPSGDSDRGVSVRSLTDDQRRLVRAAIESYASLPGKSVSAALLAAYEDAAALNETFVGFAGSPDLGTKGSYVRIDGPRVWMELVVQPAIAKPEDLHYHALWRDKQSDYGGEVGP